MSKIPIYKATVSSIDDSGIYAISFVDYPANEQNFVALKRAKQVKLKLDKQKQILTGVVLVPDQLIYRNDTQLGEYYLTFTAADIEKIAAKMMRVGAALSSTTHQHAHKLSNNQLVEIWTVTDSKLDKAVALGLGELPVGTLLASYKVNNNKYWREEVLTGNVRGFSLEGFFNFKKIINMKKQTIKPGAKKPGLVAQFVKALLEGSTEEAEALVDEADKDETDSGTPLMVFTLSDGGEVHVDADGYCTLNGEQMPAGSHELNDGNFINIDDAGLLLETSPEPTAADEAQAEAELEVAREAGKAFLKKFGSKKPAPAKNAADTKNAAEIAKLKAQIAKLEKQPSAGKAKAATSVSTELSKEDYAKMAPYERYAYALRVKNGNA